MIAGETGPALEMRGITKRFGTTVAVDGVDFVARRGRVHALLGENGAGKSTLMHIAHGGLAPDAGAVVVDGHRTNPGPRGAIGMVHQHLSLVPTMTAAENFELGGTGLLRIDAARARLDELGRLSGLQVPVDLPVRELSIVQQQRIEILKALGRRSSLLIMDEPTAVLTPDETRDLLAWVRGFVARGGSVVLVTHKLREALSVADDITVLRRGRVVWTGVASAASEEQLARAIFPEQQGMAEPPARPEHVAQVVVRASRVRLETARGGVAVSDATFEIGRGEIVGIAAVEGSGHRELLAALSGLARPSGGSLALPERIAHVPADRRRDGIVPEFSLTENVALRGLGDRHGMMPWRDLRTRTARLIAAFAVRAESPDARMDSLSGGNQQRMVVARELDGAVDLVVADNPTRGLDLNATAFVNEQLRRAADAGAAVVMHASDLDDILAVATRMLVVFNGAVLDVPLDREAIGRAMLGAR